MKAPSIISYLLVKTLNSCKPFRGLGLVFVLLFAVVVAEALPKNLQNYELVEGGYADIKPGAYVEGSIGHGGIQPDYIIDINKEPLKTLMRVSGEIGKSAELGYWDKIKIISDLVGKDVLQYNDYKNPYYRRLLKEFRDAKKAVPLSRYAICGAGVCRENAMILHFALKAAGVENKHVYAEIEHGDDRSRMKVEDHAFVVVKHEGKHWIIDSYNPSFHGASLSDFMGPAGGDRYSVYARIGEAYEGYRRIRRIHNYPRIYNPKSKACSIVHPI